MRPSALIWQGRFRAFPIQEDQHLLTVLRYIEGNPLRAKRVRRAQRWPWSSARYWDAAEGRPSYLVAGPVARPGHWLHWVNQALTPAELEATEGDSSQRGARRALRRPWLGAGCCQALGAAIYLRPRGRPVIADQAS